MFTDTLKMDKRCVIIGAAPIFTGFCEISPDDFVIVCDGGLAHAQNHHIHFHVLIGDFDSWESSVPQGNFKTITLPKEKDDTDLMYAVRYALSQGYENFLLLGVLGGRTDHFLGNLACGAYIAQQGGLCVLFGEQERLFILKDNTLRLTPVKGRNVSILPLGDEIRHVTLHGLYYPLDSATLTKEFPLGVSNKIANDTEASITIGKGTGVIILAE